MKTVYQPKYGNPDVLEIREIDQPEPQDDEVLVKVMAVSINRGDVYRLLGKPALIRVMGEGFSKPNNPIPGMDFAGQVVAVGAAVTEFQPGDDVFGDIGLAGGGSLAQYVAVPENLVVKMPANVTYEQAAAVPVAGVTALRGVRDEAAVKAGDTVAINGASGGVGGYTLQIAKAYGGEVTAIVSTSKRDTAGEAGADHVIDYTEQDFTANGHRYDVILAANGYHSLADYRRALNPGGRYVMLGGTMRQIFGQMLFGSLMERRTGLAFKGVDSKADKELLTELADLLAAGQITPVIDAIYPMSDVVEAYRHAAEGQAVGKIVVRIEHNADDDRGNA